MKTVVRVVKKFSFEAAHALDGYDGKCKDIHGHSYKLEVHVRGIPLMDSEEPTCGMVVDFGSLKKIVKESILTKFDHRLILRNDSRFNSIAPINQRLRFVSYQPTCENMLLEIVGILNNKLQGNLDLIGVKLQETETSSAEWHSKDN